MSGLWWNRDSISSFWTTTWEYLSTISRGHSFTKTMFVSSFTFGRLECSFHFLNFNVKCDLQKPCKYITSFYLSKPLSKNYNPFFLPLKQNLILCFQRLLNYFFFFFYLFTPFTNFLKIILEMEYLVFFLAVCLFYYTLKMKSFF